MSSKDIAEALRLLRVIADSLAEISTDLSLLNQEGLLVHKVPEDHSPN